MKRNIDELLKQKYKEIKYSDDIQIEFKNTKKNNNLYKVASIILLIIVATISVTLYNPVEKIESNEKNINQNIIASNDKEIELPKAEQEIIISARDVTSYATIDVKYILAIKVNKILGYTNYSENKERYTFPITKFEAEVLKCFKGEIDGNINIYTQGGIISLADWEKTLNEQQREKQRIQ